MSHHYPLYDAFQDSSPRYFSYKKKTDCGGFTVCVHHDLGSPKPQLCRKRAVIEQIRYSQGTTEELRFFSLLQSLWALKHSTKRVLH